MDREEHVRLFGDSKTTTFELTVLEETYQAAVQMAKENKWDQDYANLIIFANGISFLQGKQLLDKVSSGQLEADDAIKQLSQDLQKYMAMYSVMKYQAFLKTNDNEAMDFALNALRNECRLLRHRVDVFRQDEQHLKEDLKRLQAENEALRKQVEEHPAKADTDQPPRPKEGSTTRTPRGWLRRLWRASRE